MLTWEIKDTEKQGLNAINFIVMSFLTFICNPKCNVVK